MRLKIIDTMSITVAVSKRSGQPFLQKKVMKDDVSSPDTKNVCLPPDDTKIEKGGQQKWGRGGRYKNICACGDRQRLIIEGPSNGRPEKTLRWMIGL